MATVLPRPGDDPFEEVHLALLNEGRGITRYPGFTLEFSQDVTVAATSRGVNDNSSINGGRPVISYQDNGVIHTVPVQTSVGTVTIKRSLKGAPLQITVRWFMRGYESTLICRLGEAKDTTGGLTSSPGADRADVSATRRITANRYADWTSIMFIQQAETERALFRLFADAIDLPIEPGSIESREPPQPDIRCTLGEAGPACFELVEIIDSDLAKAVGIQLKFQSRLEADALAYQIKGLADALVFVGFYASSTNTQKQQACDALLNVIGQPPVSGGVSTQTCTLA